MNKPLAIIGVREKLRAGYAGVCPFCGCLMVPPPGNGQIDKNRIARASRETRSRAHIHARSSPKRVGELWLYGCIGCNSDQGNLSLDEWVLILDHRKDRRAPLVRAVCVLLERAGVLP